MVKRFYDTSTDDKKQLQHISGGNSVDVYTLKKNGEIADYKCLHGTKEAIDAWLKENYMYNERDCEFDNYNGELKVENIDTSEWAPSNIDKNGNVTYAFTKDTDKRLGNFDGLLHIIGVY